MKLRNGVPWGSTCDFGVHRGTTSATLRAAGGLTGAPIRMVKGRTVDLLVPAESELVIEGQIDMLVRYESIDGGW